MVRLCQIFYYSHLCRFGCIILIILKNYDLFSWFNIFVHIYNFFLKNVDDSKVDLHVYCFQIQVESTGVYIIKTLTNVLWYLDPHIEKFNAKCIYLGDDINDFRGYNDWRHQKRKEPKIRKKLLQRFHIRYTKQTFVF